MTTRPKTMITISEAARRLGVSKQTALRLAKSLPTFPTIYRLTERKACVFEDELEAFMTSLPEEVL